MERVIETLDMVIHLTHTAPSSLETLKDDPIQLQKQMNKILDAIHGASHAMKNELEEVATINK